MRAASAVATSSLVCIAHMQTARSSGCIIPSDSAPLFRLVTRPEKSTKQTQDPVAMRHLSAISCYSDVTDNFQLHSVR